MRRNAVSLLVVTLVGFGLVGCKGKNKDMAADAGQYPPVDNMYAGGSDPYQQSYSAPPATSTGSMSGSRYHTVAKGETLFALARLYYNGDASKWKVIYEANRDQIPNKDQIRVGQRLLIP